MSPLAIDAACFPHIIDRIFQDAPPASLLALRVCRAWRKRAEHQLAYHVSVTNSDGGYRLRTGAGAEIGVFSKDTPTTLSPTFLASTAVVDLFIRQNHTDLARFFKHCPATVTHRYHFSSGFSEQPVLRASCAVLFSTYALSQLRTTSKLVIHLKKSDPSIANQDLVPAFGRLSRLTVFCHDRSKLLPHQHSARPDYGPPRSDLYYVAFSAYRFGVATTVVNYEATETPGHEDWLLDYVKGLSDAFKHVFHASTLVPPAPLRYLSLDEYRGEVGDEQFEFETNEGLVSPPRLSKTDQIRESAPC